MEEIKNNEVAEAPAEIAPEVQAETPESTPDPNAEIKAVIERFSPGADTSTPEAIIASAKTVLDAMVPVYDKLYDVALASPEAAAFINDLLETGDPLKALARNYAPEEIEGAVEAIKGGDFDEDAAMYQERMKTTKDRIDLVNKNMEISIKDMSDYIASKEGWSPEKSQAFEDFVIKHYDDAKDGLITKENILILEKGFIHDEVVAEKDAEITEAEENGRVMGRNENIVEQKATKKEAEELLPPSVNGGIKTPPKIVKPKSFGDHWMKGVV